MPKKETIAAPATQARKNPALPRGAKLRDVLETATAAERDAIIAEQVVAALDETDIDADPASAAAHAAAIKRFRGRPPVGRGAARLNITMERSLLERVDAYAKRMRMTRAAVIAGGVERLMAG
jgi:hypothetical protein